MVQGTTISITYFKNIKIAYSNDSISWYSYTENGNDLLLGAPNSNDITIRTLQTPIYAKFIRVWPFNCNNNGCAIRLEVYFEEPIYESNAELIDKVNSLSSEVKQLKNLLETYAEEFDSHNSNGGGS